MASEYDTDFERLAEYSADVICRSGVDMRWRYVSPSSFAVLGWTPEEMIGMEAFALIYPDDLSGLIAIATRNFLPGVEPERASVRMRKKDGTLVWIEFTARVVRDYSTGEANEAVVTMRDISERKALEQRLSELALTDGLTEIANRRAFDEALIREWKRTLREGSQISLVLLDIDHFKEFNDQYGHQVGDDCLRAVAQAVVMTARASDIAARYGGEEIALILPSTNSTGAMELAEKVRLAVESLQITHEKNPSGGSWVTVSVGAATALSRHGGTMKMPESLLLAADNALYKAKREGRNRVATALLVAFKEP
jgi:diguanylate cyclase (GGDEF)-like protein/PAS domain S-box-containing protein